MRRVVITGVGTVNALGADVPTTFEALRQGRVAIGPLDVRDADRLAVRIGAQVRNWQPEARVPERLLPFADRVAQFALAAAAEAVAQAGLELVGQLADEAGVILGNAGGGLGTAEDAYRAVFSEGKARVHPFTVPRLMGSSAASLVGMAHGLRGATFSVTSACAASNHAIGLAFGMVRSGASRVMLAGGAEAMLTFGGVKAWEGLRVMSPDGCRPFCATRNGMVQGEGAAIYVLEDRDHALARGAGILAEIAGFAMNADARDIVAPSQDGAARAIRAAMSDARLSCDEVAYVNAHGTGTILNDKTETAAIRGVFGASADRLLVSSTKSMHGHAIGAAGAIELLAVIMALREGIVAPTAGYVTADPACDLDVVPNVARKAEVGAALSNAFAFGGLNAVLALRST